MASSKFDDREWITAFAMLKGPLKESLARRMCVSGGRVLRDEAKRRARRVPVWKYNPTSWGSQRKGTLSDSIYLAFDQKKSNTYQFTYKVSWNAKIAPYGHLVEFGYKMIYLVIKDRTGEYHTIKSRRLPTPRRVPASPFLSTTFDTKLDEARAAMIDRGREEFPKLLNEQASSPETADV